LGSTAPDASSMSVWVEGDMIMVQGAGPGIPGLLDALYQYQYPNAWNRLQKMWLQSAFTRFYDRVRDERTRGELRMAFALLRTRIAERRAWARERRRLLIKAVRKHGMRLLRVSFTALRVWAPALHKRRVRSWDSSLVRVIFTQWKQQVQRQLARNRSCAKDAEAWIQRAMAIYLAREQREALTRYHTSSQGRHPCLFKHFSGASGVERN